MKRVLIITDPFVPTPPPNYGGTERIAWLVGEGLAQKGYQVDMLAAPGSRSVNGRLLIHHKPKGSLSARLLSKVKFQLTCLLRFGNVDAVVNFGRTDYLVAMIIIGKRIVNVFQNPVNHYEDQKNLKHSNILPVGISRDQVKGLASQSKFTVIYNSVDTSLYEFKSTPGSYLVFLGRLTYNKGVDIAIRISMATGIPLKIAGNITKEDGQEDFFNHEVKPHLGNDIVYVGTVNDEQKNELLGNALGLLFPIRWNEPFGIVMAESLACGTPVIAMEKGSVSEVIDNNITGFVCGNEDQMIDAVRKLRSLDRRKCRQAAEQRFGKQTMVDQYYSLISS